MLTRRKKYINIISNFHGTHIIYYILEKSLLFDFNDGDCIMQSLSILLLLIYVTASFGQNSTSDDNNKNAVAYGKVYDPLKYPYIVYLEMSNIVSNRYSTCTGTLISPTFVLTAAHCTVRYKARQITVSLSHIS